MFFLLKLSLNTLVFIVTVISLFWLKDCLKEDEGGSPEKERDGLRVCLVHLHTECSLYLEEMMKIRLERVNKN